MPCEDNRNPPLRNTFADDTNLDRCKSRDQKTLNKGYLVKINIEQKLIPALTGGNNNFKYFILFNNVNQFFNNQWINTRESAEVC